MKTGIVMEGGAMRGLFTAGIMDVLMENNVEFDGGIGISAGATFGCNYKSKQIGRVIRYNKRFAGDKRYGSFKSFLKTGDMFDKDFCYRQIPYELDLFDTETFQKNPMEFYLGATDLRTGKPFYKKIEKGDPADIEWIRASASIPLLSNPVEIEGQLYLDGGIADSIPLEFFESIGYEKNLVIMTQPEDFVKQPNKFAKLAKFKYRKYPDFVKAFAERHLMYNKQKEYVAKREAEGKAYVIYPESSLNIKAGESNPDELQRVYDLGRKAGEKHLEQVKKFLNQTL